MGKEQRILSLYQELEDFILTDISRRLLQAGSMTATADRLIWRLTQMGESRAAIEQKLQSLTKLSQQELRKVLQNTVLTSWDNDKDILLGINENISPPLENPEVIAVMDVEFKKTLGELSNLTRTTLNQSQKDLINLLDEVDMRIVSGVQPYTAAVSDVLDNYAGKGLMIDYPTGTRRTLEAAVRCCVVTSMNQTSAQVTNQYIAQAQTNYVLISAHLGARTGKDEHSNHAGWQGKAYRLRGSEPGYPNLAEHTGYDIDPTTGQGTVLDPMGLHGYNCRHSHQPWAKGLRNPWESEHKVDSEENKKVYENTQKQRAMERAIRKTKRRLIEKQQILSSDNIPDEVKKDIQEKYDRLAYRLTEQNGAYNSFCKDNNLTAQYDRNKVADFGYSQQSKTNAGAKRYMKGH
ncbi:phage minor capsid protein [Blautia sp. MSJ-19]|nr:phage minor capsid protein [Blautia sp. MSJ-19]